MSLPIRPAYLKHLITRHIADRMRYAIPRWIQLCSVLMLWSLFAVGSVAQAVIALPGLSLAATSPVTEASAKPSAALTPSTLADLLDDPVAREKLINQLRTQVEAPSESAPRNDDEPSLPARIAAGAQEFLAEVGDNAQIVVDQFSEAVEKQGMQPERREQLIDTAIGLAIVALLTWSVFGLLRLMASYAYRKLDVWAAKPMLTPAAPLRSAARAMAVRRIGAMTGALLLDLSLVVIAGLAGYGITIYSSDPYDSVSTAQSLFINAFVAVGVMRALIRGVFSTRYPALRLFMMSDEVAVYWNTRLGNIASAVGYSLMLIEPLAEKLLSSAVASLLGLILMLIAYVYAVRLIWHNRSRVRQHLKRRAAQTTIHSFSTALRFLARSWYVLAIGYFTVLLVVSQIDANEALPFMMKATLQSLLAIGFGSLVIWIVDTLLSRRIRLPEDLHNKLPMLEQRINAYVPASLRGISILVRIVVALFVLDAWRVFDLSSWIVSDSGSAVVQMVVNVAIVLLMAAVVWTIIASFIEHRLSLQEGTGVPTARERTLLSLFRNATLIVILTMTIMVVLSQIGVDIAPLIAGAGVVGLAIGFGSQKLVQDIINGIFIQLENGMNQNDVVQVAGIFGTVEKITIRSVGIRTLDGGYHMIPFSSVDVVSNHMRDFSYHLGEYTIAHRESVDDAVQHLRYAFDELMQDELLASEVLEDISIPGVTALNEKGATIRVLIKTRPGMQWAVQRGYNRLVKKHFNAAGIELPYPHTVLYFGQDKDGYAPPANVFMQTEHATHKNHDAPAAGHTRRALHREKSSASEDVLGNELDRVVETEDAVVPTEDNRVTTTSQAPKAHDDKEKRA